MTTTKELPGTPQDVGMDATRWAQIVPFLSLDVVLPFYHPMGLYVPDSRAFKEAVCRRILDVRRQVAADQPGAAQYTAAWFLDQVGTTLGAGVQAHVVWWGAHIFTSTTHDHPALSSWISLFRHCADDPALWHGLSAERREQILGEFKRSKDMKEYERICDEVYSKPLSDWDLHMYALYFFDDEDPMGPNGPDTNVYPTVRTLQAYRFWGWMLRQLQPPELETLYENAFPIAQRPENHVQMSHLSHPRSLDIGQ